LFIIIGILKVLFVIVCALLIGAILLQSGKGGDVSAAFGGAGAQSAFGPRGATKPLEKASIYLGLAFMLLALLFSLPGFNGNLSVVKPGAAVTTTTPAPAASPEASPAAAASPVASAAASPAASPEAKADDKKAETKNADAKPATPEKK
jgi:preprotein translocase subunit SecG